jgi:hypothetical protein
MSSDDELESLEIRARVVEPYMYEPLAAGRNVEQRDPSPSDDDDESHTDIGVPADMQPRPSTQIDVAADSDTNEW